MKTSHKELEAMPAKNTNTNAEAHCNIIVTTFFMLFSHQINHQNHQKHLL
jgi:hypothetical protein